MKKLFLLMLAVCGSMWAAVAEETAEAAKSMAVPTVAVLNFEARDRQADNLSSGKSVAELLSIALMESGCAEIVERAELDKALEELHLSAVGLTSKDSQVELGKLVGAKILITGSLFKSGNKNFMVAKVIGTETSRVLGASVNSDADFTEMVPQLAEKLTQILSTQSGRLLPKEESVSSVYASLAETVKGNNRKVYVQIKEDIMITVPDPAAETELKKLLLQLGFEVVPNQQQADFMVKGEALATEGGTFNKFICAAGRVELSVYGKDGKLLATGAEKETLAGGTYVIAAKDALGQAALRLAKELFVVMK